MPSASQRRRALHALLFCTSLWALSFSTMKTLVLVQQPLVPGAGSWFLSSLCVAWRFLAAGALLFLLAPSQLKSATRLEVEQGLWLAGFATVGLCLQMDGLAYTTASTSAFLTNLYCVLIPLWVAVSRRHLPSVKVAVCGLLVLVGMALLVRLNPFALRLGRGELETVACSVMFGGQILCLEHPRFAGNSPQRLTTIMLLAMGVFALPLVALTAPSFGACFTAFHSASALLLLAILVVVCGAVPFLLMNHWQRKVTATEAGLVYCGEPVVVCLLALFLPGWLSRWTGVEYANETLTARLVLGGGLVTAANVLLQLPWLEDSKSKG